MIVRVLLYVFLFIIGIVLYSILNYLLSIPGSKKIDNNFYDDDEIRNQNKLQAKIRNAFITILLGILIILFILIEQPILYK